MISERQQRGAEPISRRLALAAFAGSIGGTVFGCDLGALASATQSLRHTFALSSGDFGLTISCSLWGTVCGSVLAGRIADRLGAKRLILLGCVMYAVAALSAAVPWQFGWTFLIASRFVCGAAIGCFTVGCPLYLSGIAPNALRGRFVALFQLQVGVGVVLAFTASALYMHVVPAALYWRCCLGTGAIPAVAVLLLQRVMPSAAMETKARAEAVASVPEPRERLFVRKNTRPLLLATSIAIFNQLSGVNILLLYLLDVLASAGIGLSISHIYTVVISCLGLVTTAVGMMYIDRLGRKPLLVLGAAGMAMCLAALGVTVPLHLAPLFYLFVLIAYNAFFAFSQGTVVWVYLSELFPRGLRGAGQGYGSSVLWITNAMLVGIFPLIERMSSVRSLFFFALMMVLQIALVIRWYPETKGLAVGSIMADEINGWPRMNAGGAV